MKVEYLWGGEIGGSTKIIHETAVIEPICFRGRFDVCGVLGWQVALIYHTPPHSLEMVSLNSELTILFWAGLPASKPHWSSGLCFCYPQQWDYMFCVLVRFLCCCNKHWPKQPRGGKERLCFILHVSDYGPLLRAGNERQELMHRPQRNECRLLVCL